MAASPTHPRRASAATRSPACAAFPLRAWSFASASLRACVPVPRATLSRWSQDAAAVRFRECENVCLMHVAWRIKEMDEETAMNTFALDSQWSAQALSDVSDWPCLQMPARLLPAASRTPLKRTAAVLRRARWATRARARERILA